LDVQQISHDPALGEIAFRELTEPFEVGGQRTSGMCFGDPAVLALFLSLLVFRLLPKGFSNRELREAYAHLLGIRPDAITPGQMTYQLRRLRLRGLIRRIPKKHRYEVTDHGIRTALFCATSASTILRPLADTTSQLLSPESGKYPNVLRKLLAEFPELQHAA
jgi:hypothetical protein